MKFTINCAALLAVIQRGAKIVERRNTYPILANVHITAGDAGLVLRCTDLDIEMTFTVGDDVVIQEVGSTTVPARVLNDILRKLPKDADVKFELDGVNARAKLVAGRSRYQLAILDPESYPDLKIHDSFTAKFTIPGKTLLQALNTVAFAISREETRYYLNGVFFHPINVDGTDHLNLVATDGHRLAQYRLDIDASQMSGIIVPTKTIHEIISIADAAGDEELTIEASATRLRVSHGDVVMHSKLIEGTFPDYNRVTPSGNNQVALVNAADLSRAVDRVAIILSSSKNTKAVALAFKDNKIDLATSNPDQGDATDEVALAADSDIDNTIGFNATYLVDVLGVLGGGEVQIAMNGASAPTLFTIPDRADIKIVLMPMRV